MYFNSSFIKLGIYYLINIMSYNARRNNTSIIVVVYCLFYFAKSHLKRCTILVYKLLIYVCFFKFTIPKKLVPIESTRSLLNLL